MKDQLAMDEVVAALKAAAEPTRLRILLLLAAAELTVKDLTQILGQSQPRISRHLKLLLEAGLVERHREGSWAYFNVTDRNEGGRLALRLIGEVATTDQAVRRDRDRAESLRREREAAAQAYFKTHAADWDRIRALHIAENDVEDAMGAALGPGPFELLVDLGTGTGRILELFRDRYARALGIDLNQDMLAYARTNLARAKLAKAQVRQGDLYNLGITDRAADAVVMHQVLHFLSDPAAAVAEAARILAPRGRIVIVDFAPHQHEFLHDAHAHERLGFAAAQVEQWLADAGLVPGETRNLDTIAAAGTEPEKLTVTIWNAMRPDLAAPDRSNRQRLLEETR